MAKHPVTMAIRALRAGGVVFQPHLYAWEPHGGTRASAEALGVDEHAVVKTLIFEDEQRAPCACSCTATARSRASSWPA